jgi:hypothetical protein
VLCDARGLCGLGRSRGHRRLLGSLAGGHDETTERFYSEASVSIFHFHLADDPAPVPASRLQSEAFHDPVRPHRDGRWLAPASPATSHYVSPMPSCNNVPGS